jgi:hypothetical protein
VLALVFIVFLLVLGLTANDDSNNGQSRSGKQSRRAGKAPDRTRTAPAAPAAAPHGKVKLEVVAARPVWVCVVDSRDRPRVAGRTLTAGERQGPFTSTSFKVTVGNGGGDLRIDGKLRDTPDRSVPLGYEVKSSGVQLLPASERPTCG